MTDVDITQFDEIDPDELHLVGKGANGFRALLAKSAEAEVLEAAKADAPADDNRPDCKTCKGDGTIMAGNRKCPDCAGSGKTPKVGESAKSFMEFAASTVAAKESGVADSGSGPTPADNCGTCKGNGTINPGPNEVECVDCGGTGKDEATTNDKELNTVDAPTGDITEGAGGRESVDKATVSTADQNDLPDSAFAFIEKGGKLDADGKTTPRSLRHFPVMDAAHVRNALARAPQSPFGDQAMPAIKAAAKKFGVEVADAEKAMDPSLGGSVFSAANPALSDPVAQGSDPADSDDTDSDDATVPGSPAWEAVDAATATAAAQALITAAGLLQTFCQREAQEVVAGQGSDVIDVYQAQDAICAIQSALGTVAQLAFHEGLEAAKSLPDDEVVTKAGRRLAGKTVNALAAARDKAKELADHIGGVLGDDDPAKKDKKDAFIANANKSIDQEVIEVQLTTEEFDSRVASAVVKALTEVDEAKKGTESVTDETTDAETTVDADETVTDDAAKADADVTETKTDDEVTTDDAAKADAEVEMTDEQIEAHKEAKAAKKLAKAAKRAEEDLATKVALTKSIEESLAKVVEQNEFLKATVETLTNDLEGVKKMAAPSNIVRTAPADAQNVAKARDETELRIAALEREARETSDPAVRAGNREIVKELRASQTATK